MIILIHGEDITESRKTLQEERKKHEHKELIQLNGEKITLSDLVLALESTSLFQKEKLLIIENLLSRRDSKEKEFLLNRLAKSHRSHTIILFEKKKIGKRILTKFLKNPKIIESVHPKILFKFVDSLGVVDKKNLVDTFHQLLKQKEPELINAMLIRQIRLLIIAKDTKEKSVPGLASWQLGKLRRQARYFSIEKLVSLYRKLLAIEAKIKSGKTPLTLNKHLDIFLLNI